LVELVGEALGFLLVDLGDAFGGGGLGGGGVELGFEASDLALVGGGEGVEFELVADGQVLGDFGPGGVDAGGDRFAQGG
jgi:hypothetical protein